MVYERRRSTMCLSFRFVSFRSVPFRSYPRLHYITWLIKPSLFSVNYGSNSPTFSHYGTPARKQPSLARIHPLNFKWTSISADYKEPRFFPPPLSFLLSLPLPLPLVASLYGGDATPTSDIKYTAPRVTANLFDFGNTRPARPVKRNNLLTTANESPVTSLKA